MEPVFVSEESSSGCESGWTLYLQHYDDFSCKKASFAHEHDQQHQHHDEEEDDDGDDDTSMVSDASSGPPHFQEHQEHDDQDDEYFNNNNGNGVFCHPTLTLGTRKRRKVSLKQESFQDFDLPAAISLDDTASSPFFNKDLKVCNKEASMEGNDSFGYSQGHSTTYFEMV